MIGSTALVLLLLVVTQEAPAVTAPSAADARLHHSVRDRRSLVGTVAKAVLDPFNLLGHLRGAGAHSDSVNVGATLPFGISAGLSASSSDAHSAAGGPASASSNAGGGGRGYHNNYGGAGSVASVGAACNNYTNCL